MTSVAGLKTDFLHILTFDAGDNRQDQPSNYLSKAIETEHLGLDYPCRNIQDFFNSNFDDQRMLEYVLRLLGYGITRHTREQKFVIMTGVGSNGKGRSCFSLFALPCLLRSS